MQEISLLSTWGRISDIKEGRRRKMNRSRNLEIVRTCFTLFLVLQYLIQKKLITS